MLSIRQAVPYAIGGSLVLLALAASTAGTALAAPIDDLKYDYDAA